MIINIKRLVFVYFVFKVVSLDTKKKGAIYLRLSREDGKETESESISNQRRLLLQFAQTHGIPIHYEFIDEGISGTTQNRKSLQKMYRAIEDGYIGTVLVKDLSRLSRNFIHTGELVEEWFPKHGVRLISVADGVDTSIVSPSNDIFAIRAVMDDWYARDISRKVRAAIRTKQRAGFCTCATLPFGYYRNEDEILIHAEQAEIVRRIFEDYVSGLSCREIANRLAWNDATVRRILMNPAYAGRLLLHKTEKYNYKSNRRIRLPESEYISFPVKPIISEQQFAQVQQMLAANGHRIYQKHALAGLVYCAVCGSQMHISGNAADGRAICSMRKRFGTCFAPSVKCSVLTDAVKKVLNEDGVHEGERNYHRYLSCIRVSPEHITICLKYRIQKSVALE